MCRFMRWRSITTSLSRVSCSRSKNVFEVCLNWLLIGKYFLSYYFHWLEVEIMATS